MTTFKDFALPEALQHKLDALGFDTPTPSKNAQSLRRWNTAIFWGLRKQEQVKQRRFPFHF